MCKKRGFQPILTALFLFLLSSCGDLDYFSSAQNYKVSGLINGISLDDCAVLSNVSEIEPYFDYNIENDTDITELVVLIKNAAGKTVGTKYRYILPKVKRKSAKSQESTGGTASENGGTASESSDTMKSGTAAVAGSTSAQKNESKTEGENKETEEKSEEKPADGDNQEAEDKENTDESTLKEEPLKEIVIDVEYIEDSLPVFRFPEELPAGFYTIVFQVLGHSGEALNSTEKFVFYLADKKMNIDDLKSYIPGGSVASHIVPPGAKILLETRISADSGFEPYIIWYQGKKRISEGSVSGGVARIFWTAPKQTGFQSIKAEVFPFNPYDEGVDVRGLSRDISLPISTRHGRMGYFSALSGSLVQWYEFWSNLTDSLDSLNKERDLVPQKEKSDKEVPIHWLPFSGTYGLGVGQADIYSLPLPFFGKIKQDEKSGRLLVRFAPLNDGVVFFAGLSKAEMGLPVNLHLSYLGENIVLTVEDLGKYVVLQKPVITDTEGFVTIAADFQFLTETIIISLAVEPAGGAFAQGDYGEWESCEIESAGNGKGSVYFGDNTNENTKTDYTAVITEIAVLYPEIPPPALEKTEGDEIISGSNESAETEIGNDDELIDEKLLESAN